MMDAADVYFSLMECGVSLDVVNGKLTAWPRDRLPEELVAPLRAHAAELTERLKGRPSVAREEREAAGRQPPTPEAIANPCLSGRCSRWGDFLKCPYCQAQDLAETDSGLDCRICKRQAWRTEGDSIERVDREPWVASAWPEVHQTILASEEKEQESRQQERLRRIEAENRQATPDLFTSP